MSKKLTAKMSEADKHPNIDREIVKVKTDTTSIKLQIDGDLMTELRERVRRR